jgi:hypothetical protein
MTDLQLLGGQEVISAYPLVRRVRLADVQDALTKGFRDFLPLLDFLADPFIGALFSIVYATICICLIVVDLPAALSASVRFRPSWPFRGNLLLRGEPTAGARP